ncbi:hypothetical protein OS493_009849 [Desmophyllum pertusum]|uniref:Uncharacterized protein n=1 Tax=Desmophyllum pertusum TaxID=174260 RepID=A0A9W9YRF7_9CNID|nr:hypothetical protein OS493_009849 [Desmophyllum pertusum]
MNQDPTKDLYSKKLYFIEHRDYNDDQSFCFMALAAVATRHLSHEEARRILDNVDLPGSTVRDLKIALATKAERWKIILEGTDEHEVNIAAAIEIQRVWRGYYTRCKLFGILHPSASVMSTALGSRFIQSPSRLSDVRTVTPTAPHTTPQPFSRILKGEQIPANALPKTKRKYKEYCENTVAQQGPSSKLMTYTEFCAVLIQEWWRLMLLRPVAPRPPPPTTDGGFSTTGVDQQRGDTADTADTEGSERKRVIDREQAAKIIQRSWRQHIDVQVYRYYRDLINFKCRGDPSSMLKCINPREAEILDAAAGVHIKFRLAGVSTYTLNTTPFGVHIRPGFSLEARKISPNIYYKIFTHRNVVDMCANAPRDYTKASTKRLPVEYVHNKRQTTEGDDRSGWYERWENNGWRLVSDRVMKRVDQDPVVYESTLKKELFSHNKVIRKQDLERKRKKKKVEWMKKMYKDGMLKARFGDDLETEQVVQSVAEGMLTITETRGQDAVEDWEVDELLEWTNGLNFDQYLYDWKEIATSAGSEYQTEQTKFLPDDPFSLTLMSR